MVRWSDVQQAQKAHPPEHDEDDLPPLVSHEPVLMDDSWLPEEKEEAPCSLEVPDSKADQSSEEAEEEEEEEEMVEDFFEPEEEDELEEPFEQPMPETSIRPAPEGMPDGPWRIGDLEFFSDFDSGNLLGAQLGRPNCEAMTKKDLRSADVQWAAEPDDGKILYQMLHNCSIRKEPHPKAKLLTKKSAGARLYASCRVTLGGWQKLVDEDGWAQLGPNIAETDSPAELKRFAPVEVTPDSVSTDDAKMHGYPAVEGAPAAPALDIQSDVLCFEVTARADCHGTAFASEECQWFHFGLRGQLEKTRLRFHVLGLSRFRRLQTTRLVSGQLLTDGLQPVFRHADGEDWQLVKGEIGMIRMPDGMIAFTFEHTMTRNLEKDQELYFALTFPYSLGRVYNHLESLIPRLIHNGNYVNREELTKSLGGHPIELLSITRRSNRSAQRLPLLPELGSQHEEDRPWRFPGRRAVFISARVHPGETPASYMLEGLLEFLASDCTAAKELLRRYVFLVLPVLNPDGVALGHHRLDLRGENLNRVYGKATLEHHPAIFAAEAACLNAHQHQGGIRLYLDLHAHSNRRGGFLLGDSGSSESRLFGWALGRQCGIFEYAQSDFSESKRGTGKSFMAKATGNPLCFTVECHYIRGHHSPYPFGPSAWRHMGASCLLALLDLDFLAKPRLSLCPSLAAFQARQREGLWALRVLEGHRTPGRSRTEGKPSKAAPITGPSRARPHFVEILGPSAEHELPRQLRMHPELIGEIVEVINSSNDGQQTWLHLHETFGASLRLRECDVRPCQEQHGMFFYGALCKVAVSKDAKPSAQTVCFLNPGTILEVSQRQVVDGVLRLRVRRDSMRGSADGWVSEFKRPCFDPRLGGATQLLRLRGRPSSLGKKGPSAAPGVVTAMKPS